MVIVQFCGRLVQQYRACVLGWELRVLHHCTMCTRHPDLLILYCQEKNTVGSMALTPFIHRGLQLQNNIYTAEKIRVIMMSCCLQTHHHYPQF